MGETNKDELQVMVQVITRNTEQLSILVERFASKMEAIQEQQEKTNARLYNGMAKEIAEIIIKHVEDCREGCKEDHQSITTAIKDYSEKTLPGIVENKFKESTVAKTINIVSIVFGAATILVLLAVTVITVLDNRALTTRNKQSTSITNIVSGQ